MRVYLRPHNKHTTLIYLTEDEKRELLSRDPNVSRLLLEKMAITVTAKERVG